LLETLDELTAEEVVADMKHVLKSLENGIRLPLKETVNRLAFKATDEAVRLGRNGKIWTPYSL